MAPRYRVKSPHYLAGCRRAAGITQKELATQLGVSRGAVAHWETGRNRYISSRYALDIALTLGRPIGELFIVEMMTHAA